MADNLTKNELVMKEKMDNILKEVDDSKKEAIFNLITKLDKNDDLTAREFGNDIQKKLSNATEQILEKTKMPEANEAGELLNSLMYEISNSNINEKPKMGFFGKLFKKADKMKFEMTSNFENVSDRIDDIVDKLEERNSNLIKDIEVMDNLLETNEQLDIAVDVYIKAGELKLEQLATVAIPELKEKILTNSTPELEHELMELTSFYDRLDKRTMDLRLTQQILKQSFPQIKLMKNNSFVLSQKIDSSINHAIPTWKNQIAISVSLLNQQKTAEISNRIDETTNQLMRKNAEMLHDSTIDIAKQNERAIVDMETLQYSQNLLVETIKETMAIQEQGRKDRLQAKDNLLKMEQEMRDKLLELASSTNLVNDQDSRERKTVYDATEQIEYTETEPKKKPDYKDFL